VTARALPMFGFPLSEDVLLVPRVAALGDAYHDLLTANRERPARWERGQPPDPPVIAETPSFVEASAQNWAGGTLLPVVQPAGRPTAPIQAWPAARPMDPVARLYRPTAVLRSFR
jgi:hypothetical protein